MFCCCFWPVCGAARSPSTFFIALIGNAIPFFLISYGETQVDAGLAAILMSTVPLTAVVLAHFFTADEKLTLGKVVGIILGTIGVVVLVGPETLSGLGGEFLFQLAILIAAVGYAVSSLITRNLRQSKSPTGTGTHRALGQRLSF